MPRRCSRIVITELKACGLDDPMVDRLRVLPGAGEALAQPSAARPSSRHRRGRPDDIAFLVYTSARPARQGRDDRQPQPGVPDQQAPGPTDAGFGDRTLSFLPLCHIAERMATVFNPLAQGQIVHFPENAGTVFNDARGRAARDLRPAAFSGKSLHSQVTLYMQDAIPAARSIYARVLAEGAALAQARLDGQPVTGWRATRYAWMQRLVRWPTCAASSGCRTQDRDDRRAGPADLLRCWYMAMGIDLLRPSA